MDPQTYEAAIYVKERYRQMQSEFGRTKEKLPATTAVAIQTYLDEILIIAVLTAKFTASAGDSQAFLLISIQSNQLLLEKRDQVIHIAFGAAQPVD